MKTSELTGAALDWAVAKCEGRIDNPKDWLCGKTHAQGYMPSSEWDRGGPIIEREKISLRNEEWDKGGWYAFIAKGREVVPFMSINGFDAGGDTALEAAMRCYVASRLGDEVEIPKELSNA